MEDDEQGRAATAAEQVVAMGGEVIHMQVRDLGSAARAGGD